MSQSWVIKITVATSMVSSPVHFDGFVTRFFASSQRVEVPEGNIVSLRDSLIFFGLIVDLFHIFSRMVARLFSVVTLIVVGIENCW